ncbi:MAG: YfiR family protein [Gemmatimonadota bacterium]|nr:YfiR family protein [Gemmatimonadota bacterium]
MRARLSLALACGALLYAASARAQEMALPVDFQVSLFARVLHFDRNLDAGEGEIVVGVLFQEGFRESSRAKDQFISTMAEDLRNSALGRPVRVVPLALGGAELPRELWPTDIDVLYVAPLRAYSLRAITDASRERGILTVTGVPQYVSEGISLGLDVEAGRTRILVNRAASIAEGADLSAELLKLARIVDR